MANDLKAGLLISQLQQDAWWGAYDFLDSLESPDSIAIHNMQINKLSMYELSARQKCKEANKFLSALKMLNIEGLMKEVENAEDEAIGKALMELANAALINRQNRNSIIKGRGEKGRFIVDSGQISKNLEELERIMRSASSGLGRGISEEKLTYLKEKLLYAYSNMFGERYKYIQTKASLAEDLATELISSDERYIAVATGEWTDRLGQQLIEDVFAFKRGTSFASVGGINLRVTINGETTRRNVQSVDELIEISGKIQLDSDKDYQNLIKIKAFSAQVKSGIEQNILTNAKRNAITLTQVGGLGDAQPVYHLYQQDLKQKDVWFKPTSEQNSKSLEAIANYQLSKYIASTALTRNEVYFTDKGFITASQWLEERKRYIRFSDPVSSLYTGMMATKRAITFASI